MKRNCMNLVQTFLERLLNNNIRRIYDFNQGKPLDQPWNITLENLEHVIKKFYEENQATIWQKKIPSGSEAAAQIMEILPSVLLRKLDRTSEHTTELDLTSTSKKRVRPNGLRFPPLEQLREEWQAYAKDSQWVWDDQIPDEEPASNPNNPKKQKTAAPIESPKSLSDRFEQFNVEQDTKAWVRRTTPSSSREKNGDEKSKPSSIIKVFESLVKKCMIDRRKNSKKR